MNSMPKHVVSSTLQDPVWNSTVISGDVVGGIEHALASLGPHLPVRTDAKAGGTGQMSERARVMTLPTASLSVRKPSWPEIDWMTSTPELRGMRAASSCWSRSG
jgi:hypothetical protein